MFKKISSYPLFSSSVLASSVNLLDMYHKTVKMYLFLFSSLKALFGNHREVVVWSLKRDPSLINMEQFAMKFRYNSIFKIFFLYLCFLVLGNFH